jgi:hypothetical protein
LPKCLFRHCEGAQPTKQSILINELQSLDCFASLAMTR